MHGFSLRGRWGATAEVASPLLLRRARMIPWIIIVGNAVFAAADPWLYRGQLAPLAVIKLAVVSAQIAGLAQLRGQPSRRMTVGVGLLCFAVGTAGGVVAGILTAEPFTTPLLCLAGALTTAAVVPWGGLPQAGAALIASVAAAVTMAQASPVASSGYPYVAIATVAILSVYVAHELGRQRAAERQARRELRRRQAELAHVQRVGTMGQMAAQLAHELTQPLGAIANFAAGARRRLVAQGADPELVAAIDHIATEALRAGTIIRRLRAFIRKDVPQRSSVDINELVREVAELVRGEAREHGIRVELRCAAGLPPVEVDAVQIEQVLLNLVRNALDALRDGGGAAALLRIETQPAGPTGVEVAVHDSGPGIPATVAARIFEPFHTTKPSGLGMGLAISRSIIEAHGGRLWLCPDGDRGATFRFTLGDTPAPLTAAAG